ncbi:hypothetical protein V6Z11_A08G076100 [Gossypium hirsutum]
MDLFAVDTRAKQSRLRHELHSLKKGSRISEEEKVEIMLARLPPKFEPVVSSASLSAGLILFQRLVNTLVECESRQSRMV